MKEEITLKLLFDIYDISKIGEISGKEVEIYESMSGKFFSIVFDLDITIKYEIENDSFDHLFGTEEYDDYADVKEIRWDKSLYSETLNTYIEKFIKEKQETISDDFRDNYEFENGDNSWGEQKEFEYDYEFKVKD